MTDIIERAAKAVTFSLGEIICPGNDIEIALRSNPELARAIVVAAIKALRMPTRAMIEAGAKGSGEDSENVACGAWEAMIDAALGQ